MAISSQHHSFDIALATLYSIEEAVLIHHFQHWIRINRSRGKNIREERCWTYQTRKDIQANFPYWSYETVKYLCEKLVDRGVLITANFNKSPIDRTLWYAFSDEKAFGVDGEFSKNVYEKGNFPNGKGKVPNAKGKSPSPIPDTITDTKEHNTPPSPLKGEVELFGRFVKLTKEEYLELSIKFSSDRVNEVIEEINDYLASTGKKPYKDYAATIRNWMRRRKQSETPQKSNVEENQALCRRVVESFKNKPGIGVIQLSSKGIEFINGVFYLEISVREPGFREKLESRLRKMNLPINDL